MARCEYHWLLIAGLRALMGNQLEIVEAQALTLTAEERARLADRLIASPLKH